MAKEKKRKEKRKLSQVCTYYNCVFYRNCVRLFFR